MPFRLPFPFWFISIVSMMGSEAIAYKEAANKFSLSALSCSVVQAKRGDFRPRLFQLPPEPGLD
uniref:Secreted protein n=1 Tax=Anguilla anguilla TaxID=7936 RepID=A0A0E9WQ61_ANGAN